MSATMASQRGRVQLEQSDMCLELKMAKMAKGGFSRPSIEETPYLIKKSRAEVWEEKKWGVEFPGHNKVKTVIDSHPAMLYQNQTDRCLPSQNGTAQNPQTCWRCKGTGAPSPEWRRQTTPETTPPLPRTPPLPWTPPLPRTPPLPETPPVPPSNNAGAQHSGIVEVLAGYAYSHTSLRSAESFTLDS